MALCIQTTYDPEVEQLLRQYYQTLSEKDRRRFAAVEAITLGRGGMSYIASVLGCSRRTVARGIQELKQLPNDTAGKYRTRRPGGGCKLAEEKNPHLVPALEQILSNENEIAGDPMKEQKWVAQFIGVCRGVNTQ